MRRKTGFLPLATFVLATAFGCAGDYASRETPSNSDRTGSAPGAGDEAEKSVTTPSDQAATAQAQPEPEPSRVAQAVQAEEAPPAPPAPAPLGGGRVGSKGDAADDSGMGYAKKAKSRNTRRSRRSPRSAGPAAKIAGGLVRPPIAAPPPMGQPEFDTEGYDHIAENDFIAVADDPRSTFSIDVDTASYSNVRRFLREGQKPPADAIRLEELINYFDYDYDAPEGADPFSMNAEVSACPWNEENLLVHVGLQGQEIDQSEVPTRNLVFLLDVSGSMNSPDKLPLLKQALEMLVNNLRPQDKVSLVVYAGASGVVLEPTAGTDKARIMDALRRLEAGGSTNGGQGIELAYRLAQRNFVRGGINRVLLATDGDFNVGVTSRGELTRLIEDKRKSGVFLSVFGFGSGNLQDSQMEALADKGNGNYAYIDSAAEARKVLVEQVGGTLVTIAKDVKLQVEFNPAEVASYRLIGYENRKLAHRDFNDDTKDAGEIGAGHTVTALYEVVPASKRVAGSTDELKYQSDRGLTRAAGSGELMTVKIRYKDPDADQSKLLSFSITGEDRSLRATSDDFRFAAAVAEFGLLLRDSKYQGDASYAQVERLAKGALGQDPHGHRRGFLELVAAADRVD